jgi:hypothetical protein
METIVKLYITYILVRELVKQTITRSIAVVLWWSTLKCQFISLILLPAAASHLPNNDYHLLKNITVTTIQWLEVIFIYF